MEISRQQIEEFLFQESDLLDRWQLVEWSELFAEDGTYLIPSTDLRDGDPSKTLYLISDDHFRIVERAKRLLKKEAHVEYPHSRTNHLYSNIRIQEVKDGVIYAECKFITSRTKREVLDFYVGRIEYQLVVRDEALKILQKKVLLEMDALRPQGKVSVIL